MPKFRVLITIDNENGWQMGLFPYVSASQKLRRILVIWGWVFIEAKLLKE